MARRLGLAYVDTGAMYRAATVGILRRIDSSAASGLGELDDRSIAAIVRDLSIEIDPAGTVRVDGVDATEAIRSPAATTSVSRVSAVPAVREILVPVQRNLADDGGVLEGRDIGTAVFPDAEVKVFLTASVEERARRRGLQTGEDDLLGLARDLSTRDAADSSRVASPLQPASDATVIDTTAMTLGEVIAAVEALCEKARASREQVGGADDRQ